jgi:Hypoxia induced protein conserved region
MQLMQTFLIIVVVGLMIATVVALVKGIISFLKATEEDLKNPGGPSAGAVRQNKMMMARVGFQAAAIVVVMLLLLLSRG